MRMIRTRGINLPSTPMRIARRVRWGLLCFWNSRGLVDKSADPRWLDVLHDPGFRHSMRRVRDLSSLDTPRLANLWQWCGMSEEGALIEVGAFRGGTALHLSNRWPRRRIFVCDTFDGFATLRFHADYDRGIQPGTWCNHDAASVEALFRAEGRDVRVLRGIFPASDRSGEVADVGFAHIDVDLYESCLRSLDYLAARALPRAFFVVNDYLRDRTRGVRQAVADFVAHNPEWMAFPAYPGQGLLFNRAAFGEARERRRSEAGSLQAAL